MVRRRTLTSIFCGYNYIVLNEGMLHVLVNHLFALSMNVTFLLQK